MNTVDTSIQRREPWNKGKLTGQKAPLRLRDIWAIRIRLQLARKVRDLALFDLAIDSKLRACDLVKLRVRDVGSTDHLALDRDGAVGHRGHRRHQPLNQGIGLPAVGVGVPGRAAGAGG
jgi:hypothetical protein